LGNGAGLYAVYCSDCHGNAPAARLNTQNESNAADEYAELMEIAQKKAEAEQTAIPEDEEWPEWAERPDPNAEKKPDEREEIMNLVTAAIEKAHEINPEGELENAGGNADGIKYAGFKPQPGVTDLSRPQTFYYGTSAEEVFNSIADGTGAAMPGWRTELGSDEAIWDVVNYIRSFWSEEWL
jgi:mono/diheme cytochrome c family protein